MTLSRDFFELACKLELESDHASQRRAISSAYYAIFHALAGTLTASILGYSQPGPNEPLSEEWVRVYRSIEHRSLREALKLFAQTETQTSLSDRFNGFGAMSSSFSMLQDMRHRADYDPYFDVLSTNAARTAISEALVVIGLVNTKFDATVSRKLAIEVLLKNKSKR